MVVRLPRILTATGQIERERKWLPRLAPRLPLAVPIPIANGMPAEGYAWHWSIYRWLEGPRPSTASPIRSKPRPSWVSSSPHCSGLIPQVGRPLMSTTLSEVCLCHAGIPPPETRSGGCAAHSMPPRSSLHGKRPSMRRWQGGDVWLHGDLHAANLLARHGRLSAVIDFGCMGVGDPACNVMVAWTYLSAETRDTFRAAMPLDDTTWARGRGWALSFGLIALPYYETTNPELAGIERRSIGEVLADEQRDRSSGGC